MAEEIEGQEIARRLLEALEANQRPDWEAFDAAYRGWLLKVAAQRFARLPNLRQHFEGPEELVHAFLADKVYPPRQTALMLGAPGRGECPLGPRLAASLGNYCVDVLRTAGRPSEGATALETAEAREERPLPTYEDLANLIHRQIEAVREALPLGPAGGAPYRGALLLRLRLDWAAVFDGVTLPRDRGTSEVELSVATLEALTVWAQDETDATLGESVLVLGQAWDELKARVATASGRRVSPKVVGEVLRIPPDLWHQWVSRGRQRLKNHLGTRYAELFALWA